MKTVWDAFLFNPLILVIIFALYLLILFRTVKNHSASQWAFFAQTFFYWFALALIINDSFDVRDLFIKASINNIEGLGLVGITSTSFYAFIIMLFFTFGKRLFSKVGWQIVQYVMVGFAMIGIGALMVHPTMLTLILAVVCLGFAIIAKSSFFLAYSEKYGKKFFPFKTVSLIAPLMTFAFIFGTDLNNIMTVVEGNMTSHTRIIILGLISLVSLIIVLVLYGIYTRIDYFIAVPFTVTQQAQLEPFNWKRIVVIFLMFFLIVVLKEVSQSNIFQWLLAQRTWEKYPDNNRVQQFLRLNNQLYLIPQFLGAYLACNVLYNKIGVKYTFGLGLMLWFIFFTISAFNSSPEAFLFLQMINGLAYAMCFYILFAMVCEWQYRAPKGQPIIAQFQILYFGTEFLTRFVDDIMKAQKVGIFKDYVFGNEYIPDAKITQMLDDVTTIIFTICAIVILLILAIFYYVSDYILAEYRNHIRLLVPKINIMLRNSFIDRIKSNIPISGIEDE